MKPMNDTELVSLDSSRLAAMPAEEARAVLIRVLDAFQRSELTNFDHLVLFGILLSSSGHHDLDLAAVEWISTKPSSVRLDIVSTLLSGLWRNSVPGARVNRAALDALLRIRDVIQPSDDAEYQCLLALSEVAAGKVFHHVVQGTLEKALQKNLSNTEMDRILKGVIRQSLRE
jgi:hypothetical protein